jgi:hypothetical protein
LRAARDPAATPSHPPDGDASLVNALVGLVAVLLLLAFVVGGAEVMEARRAV